MKRHWAGFAIFGAGIVLGTLSQQHFFTSPAQASSTDVHGANGVAVDTYHNSAGTFVLFSSGRLTQLGSGGTPSVDVETSPANYTIPPAANITQAPASSKGSMVGSANVSVRAVSRQDATYILFSDGSMRLPDCKAAAAGSGLPSSIVIWNSDPSQPVYQQIANSVSSSGQPGMVETSQFQLWCTEIAPTTTMNAFNVKLSNPVPAGNTPTAMGVVSIFDNGKQQYEALGLVGQIQSDNQTFLFTPSCNAFVGYNNSQNTLVTFQFVITIP